MKMKITISDSTYTVYPKDLIYPWIIKGDITTCYTHPSEIKKAIYRECIVRTYEIEKHFGLTCYNYGVLSYNCMMFTYGAYFELNGEIVMMYYETKTRRELYVKRGFEL